jgi:hypothetical protein
MLKGKIFESQIIKKKKWRTRKPKKDTETEIDSSQSVNVTYK